MDRLLCGDVGYGKTEVAMRAAFKAVADSKQVAVLAPTTVLVFQHYETFRRRMAAFPVRIEMLSRFRSARGAEESHGGASRKGRSDILIGTHRLLSRDVHFHDLGLLIVDEEQRFGVTHKERLKEMSRNVDVLTHDGDSDSAHAEHVAGGPAGYVGDRDAAKGPAGDPDGGRAVFRVAACGGQSCEEIERGGQVFFVHNRVESIYSMAELVQKLVPKARVVVGTGRWASANWRR